MRLMIKTRSSFFLRDSVAQLKFKHNCFSISYYTFKSYTLELKICIHAHHHNYHMFARNQMKRSKIDHLINNYTNFFRINKKRMYFAIPIIPDSNKELVKISKLCECLKMFKCGYFLFFLVMKRIKKAFFLRLHRLENYF